MQVFLSFIVTPDEFSLDILDLFQTSSWNYVAHHCLVRNFLCFDLAKVALLAKDNHFHIKFKSLAFTCSIR